MNAIHFMLTLALSTSVAAGCNALDALGTCEDDATCPCEGDGCTTTTPLTLLGQGAVTTQLGDGRLAIAAFDERGHELVVALERPGKGARTLVPVAQWATAVGVETPALAIAADGEFGFQIAWLDPERAELRWAQGDAQGLSPSEHVDGSPEAPCGGPIALAVDRSGVPHLAFRDAREQRVRYATRPAHADASPQAARWVLRDIEGCAGEQDCPHPDGERFGPGLDLTLIQTQDQPALPRIAFYDARRGDLKLAGDQGEGTWMTTTVDGRDPITNLDNGDVGRFVSIDVNPSRSIGLAYVDDTRGALRFLGPGEAPRIIDSGVTTDAQGRARHVDVGQFATLRYDPLGRAHILSVDATTPAVRYSLIRGAADPRTRTLDLPPGAWFSLETDGLRLIGALGVFTPGAAQATHVQVFDLTAEAP